VACLGVASVVLSGAVGSARGADPWSLLSARTIKSADPSVEIKSAEGRWEKVIKKMKISVEGVEVQITKVFLNWKNRRSQTLAEPES
jgi:hypothetical protein